MKIQSITVENHRRLRDLAIEVRGHAVIVGANDVGKTSLLRLLNLLLGATAGQLYSALTFEDLADQAKPMTVEVEFGGFTDAERTVFPHEISIAQGGHQESLRLRLTAAADPDDPELLTIERWFPDSGHQRSPSREQFAAIGWRYLPATRTANAAQLDGPKSAWQALLSAVDLGEARTSLAGLLQQFNTTLSSSVTLEQLRGQIAAHLSKSMPTGVAADELVVRTSADPAVSALENVSLFFDRGGQHVPVSEQSDGLRQLMMMTLFDLAQGAANIVAIDEPELHLHPASQRTMAELLQSSANQKIVVTHSPYIVHRFDPSLVVTITPDGQCHQVAENKMTQVQRVLANWWSPRLLEVLTSRYALIVEGLSDRIFVEAAAEAMNISLSRLGAVVFELDGADKFRHVHKLLGKDGFGIPMLGLVDDAEQGSWHVGFGGSPKKAVGKGLWVSTPDLEGEYCTGLGGPAVAQILVQAGVCRENGVLQACQAASYADIAPEPLAEFCRGIKVTAAVAVSAALTEHTVAKVPSVHGLLDRLRTDAA
ncbi:ATP-dependent nuclease [Amycolatopsis jiangsuensis]|uniref:Putative ATP-dependent endonuclease of OLD family n=1 Tax=Amycolatopsis jiangsuensis TaxID=1181879 RepID=A0A840ITF6_9PSEU|nr:AAA family ATPase [Amycolatopsis jiangsuensis]MBB4684438.1 putative ATP-dependent endonuclease of OLD family [Amycolatopsis jiangsuensis]